MIHSLLSNTRLPAHERELIALKSLFFLAVGVANGFLYDLALIHFKKLIYRSVEYRMSCYILIEKNIGDERSYFLFMSNANWSSI